MSRHHYWVYILTNRSEGFYIGVTNDLTRRIFEHRSGEVAGFTQRYRMNRLVYFEEFQFVSDAIAREKQLKGWRRSKKKQLIESLNPDWRDLGVEILGLDDECAPTTK